MNFGKLKIRTPDGQTRDYSVDQPAVSIGRAPSNDLIIGHVSISRRHARLTFESGQLMIEDLGSIDGTFIGGQRISPSTPSEVPENQILRLGDVEIVYFAPPPLVAASPFIGRLTLENIAPAVAPDGPPINLSLIGPAQSIEPGNTAAATLIVQNRGSVVDDLNVQLTGIPTDWFSLSKGHVPLLPSAQETLTITFHPPRKPEVAVADYSFVVTVTSRAHRARATVQGTLKVLPFQQLEMQLNPPRSRREFRLIVDNQGNVPVMYQLSGVDNEPSLNYRFKQTAVTLQVRQRQSIQLQVTSKRAPKIGRRETRTFNVIATPLDPPGAEAKAAGQLIVGRLIPIRVIVVAILLAVLIGVIGAIVYSQVCGTLGSNMPLCPASAKLSLYTQGILHTSIYGFQRGFGIMAGTANGPFARSSQ